MKRKAVNIEVVYHIIADKIESTIVPLIVGNGQLNHEVEKGDIVILNPESIYPFYFLVEKVIIEEPGQVEIIVKYLTRKNVLATATILNAKMIPICNSEVNHQYLVTCMAACE